MDERGWLLAAKKRKERDVISLSPTGLSEFLECEQCGFRKAHGLGVPRYKYPSLPSGVDIALHELSNLHRLKGTPPPLWAPLLPGRRLYPEIPKKLSWLWEEERVRFGGTPDEWVLEKDGRLSVLDFKTKGFLTKPEIFPGYQLQMDSYSLLAGKTGGFPKLSGKAYLLYFVPDIRKSLLEWHVEVMELEVDPRAALNAIKRAAKLVRGPIPASAADCEICSWLAKCTDLKSCSAWLQG